MSPATTPTYRRSSSVRTWHSARESQNLKMSESRPCRRNAYTFRRKLSRNGWIRFWSRLVVFVSWCDGWIVLILLFSSFLAQAKMEVEDLFVDLADGIKLLKLLEIISGEKLGKPNSGRMRVHKIENLNKSLAFLHTKVSIGYWSTVWTAWKSKVQSYAILQLFAIKTC